MVANEEKRVLHIIPFKRANAITFNALVARSVCLTFTLGIYLFIAMIKCIESREVSIELKFFL